MRLSSTRSMAQPRLHQSREHLQYTLEISARGDSSLYLLNPKIAGAADECQARISALTTIALFGSGY